MTRTQVIHAEAEGRRQLEPDLGAAADALATEAERAYDLSKARRRRVGRPSLGARGTSPRVSFRATPELYRAAKRRAREEGRSVSELAREAVARYVGS